MNSILQLKGRFEKRKNDVQFGIPKLPVNTKVTSEHMRQLKLQLMDVMSFWQKNTEIKGALVSVHYIRIIAKSNRLRRLLGDTGKKPADSICGAKFSEIKGDNGNVRRKHVFTHYVQISALETAIDNLEKASSIIEKEYKGCITAEDTENLGKMRPYTYESLMKKTVFIEIVLDSFFVEKFSIDRPSDNVTQNKLVTIYKTDVDTIELLEKFGVSVANDKVIDGTTLLLDPGQMETLYRKAPYLIAMSVTDFRKLKLEDIYEDAQTRKNAPIIPEPGKEPVVGVIDTHFNEKVYFHKWVEYTNMLPAEIELEKCDYDHGTAVTSIIVDGPKGNPKLDDGCGRFKVRHFGVATNNGFSSFSILRNIREIVANNRDIKVWNLSLGSREPVEDNFISPEAAELDNIQSLYDVVFIVAGTNNPNVQFQQEMKIGAPADSLNSMVVNSVTMENECASYSRIGPVLSFFHKPDVSYYGGDGIRQDTQIAVCVDDLGAIYKSGTSFAAPWITRKMAYLIYVMGLSREVAKALLIDSAAQWNSCGIVSNSKGYGVVPKRIEDILKTADDEIKFFITGTTDDYETYNYNLPVPVVDGKHPFYARAVMTFFPQCDRNQGVDYTGTEMDIHFGRVMPNGKLKTIDDNRQSEEGQILYEDDAREIYRKWDNVKCVCDEIKGRAVPRKSYDSGMWGISILTKDRVTKKNKDPLQFGLVITIKEMFGKNRINEFIKSCMARNWLVTRLDVQNQIDIYTRAEEEIEFE